MNEQQRLAYEALCAKVPEAFHLKLRRVGRHWERRVRGIWESEDADSALAILTAHLEAMLPKGVLLYWPSSDLGAEWAYSLGVSEELRTIWVADPDRFIALCRAVEASR